MDYCYTKLEPNDELSMSFDQHLERTCHRYETSNNSYKYGKALMKEYETIPGD